MSSWEQFFARHRDYSVEVTFYGCKDHFTLDELYEAFKARMLAEAAEAATETPLPANARVIATCDLSTTAQETPAAPKQLETQLHGHVTPRSDGVKARCGGPALCETCARELASLNR